MKLEYNGEWFEFEDLPTNRELQAAYDARLKERRDKRIGGRPYDDTVPLSAGQERLWLVHQSDPTSVSMSIMQALRARGPLELDHAQSAIEQLVARHEALRMVFEVRHGKPICRIVDADWFQMQVVDLTEEAEAEAEARRRVEHEIGRPFELSESPPFRATIYRLGSEDHVLLLVYHHIIVDEWSNGVILGEFGELYQSRVEGRDHVLGSPKAQYPDFTLWEREYLDRPQHAEDVAFWEEYLDPPVARLPWPQAAHAFECEQGVGVCTFTLGADSAEGVQELARAADVSDFVLMWTFVAAFLCRALGADSPVLGGPVTLRDRSELQGLIGFLINAVPLRLELDSAAGIRANAAAAGDVWREARPRKRVPLQELCRIARHCGGDAEALTEIAFTYLSREWEAKSIGEVSFDTFEQSVGYALTGTVGEARGPLSIVVAGFGDPVWGVFEFDRGIFDPEWMAEFAASFAAFVDEGLAAPDAPIATLSAWRRPPSPLDGGPLSDAPGTLVQAFEESCRTSPDAIAVVSEDASWTYADTDRRASRVAAALWEAGVRPGDRVGLCFLRSPELIAAMLGTMRLGAAWVPLEPEVPPARRAHIQDDSGLKIALADDEYADDVAGVEMLTWSQTQQAAASAPDIVVDPEMPAYVLYTSGSTGRPKGVIVPHRAPAGFCRVQDELFGHPDPVVAVKASYGFDMFVGQVFPALSLGGTAAIVPPGAERVPERFAEFVRGADVTVIIATPTQIRLLHAGGVDLGDSALRQIHLGGEALDPTTLGIAGEWGAEVLNVYGPTEMCCCQTFHRTCVGDDATPIGVPTPGHAASTVDPLGGVTNAIGEIVLSGRGEAYGYVDMPRRTATAFVPSPFGKPGQRMYATGDVGSVDDDGLLHFHGRNDTQLQVRGVRVEIGAIEACLAAGPGVTQQAVLTSNERDGRADGLVGFVVCDSPRSPQEISDHLHAHLPSSAVPARVVVLDEMPTLPSGKVDRQALAQRVASTSEFADGYFGPRDATESMLVEIWQDALGCFPVGIRDDFYALGGHSMLAIEIARRIEEKMGREVDVANLIKHTTIESLAEAIRASDDVARQSPIVKLSSGDGLPMFLIHPVGGEVFSYRDLVSGLRGRFNVHGIRQVTALSEPDVSLHAEEYIEAIKEVQPEGPYLVSGWSYGGIVAAEIARLLALAGDGVHNLILLDTTPSTPPEREKALTMSEHEWLLGFEYDRSRQLGVYGPVGEARGFARLKATTSRGMRLELAERMKRNGLLPASASEEQWLHYLEIYRNNYLAQANWMPDFDGLDVPTVLVHARDSSSEEAAHLLWSAFGLEIDEVVSVPGTHGDFLEGERGAALGARLEPFFAVDAPAPHG